jgi:hypothetical protein
LQRLGEEFRSGAGKRFGKDYGPIVPGLFLTQRLQEQAGALLQIPKRPIFSFLTTCPVFAGMLISRSPPAEVGLAEVGRPEVGPAELGAAEVGAAAGLSPGQRDKRMRSIYEMISHLTIW